MVELEVVDRGVDVESDQRCTAPDLDTYHFDDGWPMWSLSECVHVATTGVAARAPARFP